MEDKVLDVAIIGSGPAGLTAAIYTARARLNPVVIAGMKFGGQLMNTTVIENFPGFEHGIDGPVLMDQMIKQAQNFGTTVLYQDAIKIEDKKEFKEITLSDNSTLKSKAVIIATGATPKRLNIPGENEFYGRGVSTCATCDGALYRDKVIAVVGGGDSAMEEASFLTRFATKLYLIVRKDTFKASPIMVERVLSNPKVEVLYNTEVKEVVGNQVVTSLKIFNNKDNTESNLEVSGMFLAIGHIPVTDFVKGLVELDENGYIKATKGVFSSVEGIFVAGDVEDTRYRQAITAAGAGCKAAIEVQKWLGEN